MHSENRAEEAIRLLQAVQEMEQASLDKQFEHSKAYITLVVGLGYVGFFAIWNFAHSLIPAKANSLTGIMMGVSLLAFIMFEVRKMFVMQGLLVKRAGQSMVEPNVTDIEGLIRFGLEKERQNRENLSLARSLMQRLITEWKWAFGVTMLFGCSAAILLLYNLFAQLTGIIPMWPGEAPV